MDFSEKLNPAEAAAYLGVSKDWLLTNMRHLSIPFYQVARRRYYFMKSELNDWLTKSAKKACSASQIGNTVKLV